MLELAERKGTAVIGEKTEKNALKSTTYILVKF